MAAIGRADHAFRAEVRVTKNQGKPRRPISCEGDRIFELHCKGEFQRLHEKADATATASGHNAAVIENLTGVVGNGLTHAVESLDTRVGRIEGQMWALLGGLLLTFAGSVVTLVILVSSAP